MTTTEIPNVKLNNGVEMPLLGFGVYQIPAEETEQAVTDALPPATGCSTQRSPTATRRRSGGRSRRATSRARSSS